MGNFSGEFYKDLRNAQSAELLVKNVFENLTSDYSFSWVGEQKECYYKGDILATAADGRKIYIEVKKDGRIADTGNVLCEYGVYYKEYDYFGDGNMCNSDTSIYCIVSEKENKIYVIDYSILKANYKKGIHKIIEHSTQKTYCYLLSLYELQKLGGLLYTINY